MAKIDKVHVMSKLLHSWGCSSFRIKTGDNLIDKKAFDVLSKKPDFIHHVNTNKFIVVDKTEEVADIMDKNADGEGLNAVVFDNDNEQSLRAYLKSIKITEFKDSEGNVKKITKASLSELQALAEQGKK